MEMVRAKILDKYLTEIMSTKILDKYLMEIVRANNFETNTLWKS